MCGISPDLVYIRFLLRKAEFTQTLILHLLQQVVLEKFFYESVLERFAGRVFLMKPLDIGVVQDAVCEASCGVGVPGRNLRDMGGLEPFDECVAVLWGRRSLVCPGHSRGCDATG